MNELQAAADLLRALAHPTRLAIVLQVREGERCVHELVDRLGIPQPLASQHLRVLRSAGVLASHRRGKEVAYGLVDEHVLHIALDAITHGGEPARAAR